MDYFERFKRYLRFDFKDSRSKFGFKDSRYVFILFKFGIMDSSNIAYI